MLRVTDNRWVGLFTNDVKRMMFNEFTGMNLYCDDEWFIQLSDIWKVLERMSRGDVVLWITNGIRTRLYVGRVLSDFAKSAIRYMSDNSEIKIFRIERMTADFDVVELEIND